MFSKYQNSVCAASCIVIYIVAGVLYYAGQFSPAVAADQKQKNKSDSTEKASRSTPKIKKTIKPYKGKLSVKNSISLGKSLYNQYQCYDCHSISGKGCDNGFSLDGVGTRRTNSFIKEHLIDPDKHFDKHPQAFGTDMNLMPPQNLERWEIDSLVDYLHSLK